MIVKPIRQGSAPAVAITVACQWGEDKLSGNSACTVLPMDKKKSRNFSSRDRYLLADFIKAVAKVIENKRHNGRSCTILQ